MGNGTRGALALRAVGKTLLWGLRAAWYATMILTPLLAFWVSSSFAAYRNYSIWACAGIGLILFPGLPVGWEFFYQWRKRRVETPKRSILTRSDRLTLSTLLINGTFLGIVVSLFPVQVYRSLATRGDWVLAGSQHSVAVSVRRKLFSLAQLFEDRYIDAKKEEAQESYGESDKAPDQVPEKASGDDSKPKRSSAATEHWPSSPAPHPLAVNIPASDNTSPEAVALFLQGKIEDPFELAKAINDYIVARLDYDFETLRRIEARQFDDLPSQKASPVFESKTGVCEGYARLFVAMGEAAGFEVAYIVGKSRQRWAKDSDGLGHAWNAIKIEGKWYFVDATWNDATDQDRKPAVNSTYLFTPPRLFVLDHLPEDPKWQLLEDPVTAAEFMRQPFVRPTFAQYGLELITPTRSQVSASGSVKIRIANDSGTYMLASLSRPGTNHKSERCELTNGPEIRISCPLPAEGRYVVNLFANHERYGSYHHVGAVLVNSR